MNKNNKLPNFLCVGTSKTGTSSMHLILNQHSDIYLNKEVKESFFFCRNYEDGIDTYSKLFSEVKNEKAIGEIAPSYLFMANPKHIQEHLGNNIKLIFIFRNPVDRAFSFYKMRIRGLKEKKSFKEIISSEIKNGIINKTHNNYVHKGIYDTQLQNYLDVFDKKNMLFLIYETDIEKNIDKTYKRIQNFLNVEPIKLDTSIRMIPGSRIKSKKIDNLLNSPNFVNQFAKKVIPSKIIRIAIKRYFTKRNNYNSEKSQEIKKSKLEEQRPCLDQIFKQSILNLEKMIDKDLSIWYK